MYCRPGKQRMLTLLAAFLIPSVSFAADVQVYGSDGSITLDGLKPLSPQITAILAYHAMRAGTGCPLLGDGEHLHCNLTDALGLGYQCSPAHTGIVKQWFGKDLRVLFGDEPLSRSAIKNDALQWLCESTPDGASAHSSWTYLRVRTDGDQVTVDGTISSVNRNNKVGIYGTTSKVHAVFRVHADSIEVLARTDQG